MAVPGDVGGGEDEKAASEVEQHAEIAPVNAIDEYPAEERNEKSLECVAAMMYQLTPAKFIPLPKSETNMAKKKKRKPRWAQISFQSTVCVAVVAIERTSLLSWEPITDESEH